MDLPVFELPFFTNMLILLVVARVFGELFERLKQPAMIGEILAGILVGPSLLNLVHRTENIHVISELGVFMLVIIAGLEIKIEDIVKSLKGRSLIISILAFFLPITAGFAVGYAFGLESMTTAFLGLCVAITALPVSVRILMDLGKMNTEIGKKIISVAILDDVLALTILGILLNLNNTDLSFASVVWVSFISLAKLFAFLVILALAYLGINKLSNKGNYIEELLDRGILFLKGKESLFAIFMVFILLFSMITETLGFHFVIGAFFASMLISEHIVGRQNFAAVEKSTTSLAMGFLAPIFFAGIGLEFNFSAISNIPLLLAVLGVSYFTKIAGGYLGGRFAGLNGLQSLTLGIGLNARGIMELVIANIAYKAELIDLEIFSILVIMGVFTTLTTPTMLGFSFKKLENQFQNDIT